MLQFKQAAINLLNSSDFVVLLLRNKILKICLNI